MIYVLQCGQCARQFVATDDEHGELVLKFARHMRDEHSPGLAEWKAPQVWRLEMPQRGVAGTGLADAAAHADAVAQAAVSGPAAPVVLGARSADQQHELGVRVESRHAAMCFVWMGPPDHPVYEAWLMTRDLARLAHRLVNLVGPETP